MRITLYGLFPKYISMPLYYVLCVKRVTFSVRAFKGLAFVRLAFSVCHEKLAMRATVKRRIEI